ncbi:MAG: hypothetical protein JWM11_5711, partial [Planctomycetaceae bacterium]|nr:hypothetical protein [Planctomycetaceae bacterium]
HWNLSRFQTGKFRKMNLQDAVREFGRHAIFIDAVRQSQLSLPVATKSFVPPKSVLGNSFGTTAIPLQRQDATGDRQVQIFRPDAGQLCDEQKFRIQLVDIDGRVLPFQSQSGNGILMLSRSRSNSRSRSRSEPQV